MGKEYKVGDKTFTNLHQLYDAFEKKEIRREGRVYKVGQASITVQKLGSIAKAFAKQEGQFKPHEVKRDYLKVVKELINSAEEIALTDRNGDRTKESSSLYDRFRFFLFDRSLYSTRKDLEKMERNEEKEIQALEKRITRLLQGEQTDVDIEKFVENKMRIDDPNFMIGNPKKKNDLIASLDKYISLKKDAYINDLNKILKNKFKGRKKESSLEGFKAQNRIFYLILKMKEHYEPGISPQNDIKKVLELIKNEGKVSGKVVDEFRRLAEDKETFNQLVPNLDNYDFSDDDYKKLKFIFEA